MDICTYREVVVWGRICRVVIVCHFIVISLSKVQIFTSYPLFSHICSLGHTDEYYSVCILWLFVWRRLVWLEPAVAGVGYIEL